MKRDTRMHAPTPDPERDDEDGDVRQPPVPPDQAPDVIPQGDPPRPRENTPLIARGG